MTEDHPPFPAGPYAMFDGCSANPVKVLVLGKSWDAPGFVWVYDPAQLIDVPKNPFEVYKGRLRPITDPQ